MGNLRALRSAGPVADESDPEHYRQEGYAVVRGLFSPSEIAEIAAATDQLYAEGVDHGRSFRHGNLYYDVPAGADGMPLVRMVQWPSYHQALMNAVRLDRRIAGILQPLIGGDLKQIINQVHWKAPSKLGHFAWHQDSRSRRPASAYRNLADSYVQTGLAIDRHRTESGCMPFVPRSHLLGDLGMDCSKKALGTAMTGDALSEIGLSEADTIELELDPGDVALWSPYLVHGSGTNSSDHKRRLYINGYVRTADCDRGEWAFRNGQPVPLGRSQALVHYEELYERPEPHYV